MVFVFLRQVGVYVCLLGSMAGVVCAASAPAPLPYHTERLPETVTTLLLANSQHPFGHSIATNGKTLAIGSYRDDTGGTNVGTVYLITDADGDGNFFDETADTIVEINHRTAGITLGEYAYFGIGVALRDDELLVAAFENGNNDSRKVALYRIHSGGNGWADITEYDVVKTVYSQRWYAVMRVVDGDTVVVRNGDEEESVRLIGIDTPETVHPNKSVECFGREAADYMKQLLVDTRIILESDPSQGDRDRYGRLLRYLILPDGTNVNERMIRNGYAREYTYRTPYVYQSVFKNAENDAREHGRGLWGIACKQSTEPAVQQFTPAQPALPPNPPQQSTEKTNNPPQGQCVIKGNINSKKEKLYHLPGCPSYTRTIISAHKGERWFCTKQEAIDAGWQRAGNC